MCIFSNVSILYVFFNYPLSSIRLFRHFLTSFFYLLFLFSLSLFFSPLFWHSFVRVYVWEMRPSVLWIITVVTVLKNFLDLFIIFFFSPTLVNNGLSKGGRETCSGSVSQNCRIQNRIYAYAVAMAWLACASVRLKICSFAVSVIIISPPLRLWQGILSSVILEECFLSSWCTTYC